MVWLTVFSVLLHHIDIDGGCASPAAAFLSMCKINVWSNINPYEIHFNDTTASTFNCYSF